MTYQSLPRLKPEAARILPSVKTLFLSKSKTVSAVHMEAVKEISALPFIEGKGASFGIFAPHVADSGHVDSRNQVNENNISHLSLDVYDFVNTKLDYWRLVEFMLFYSNAVTSKRIVDSQERKLVRHVIFYYNFGPPGLADI